MSKYSVMPVPNNIFETNDQREALRVAEALARITGRMYTVCVDLDQLVLCSGVDIGGEEQKDDDVEVLFQQIESNFFNLEDVKKKDKFPLLTGLFQQLKDKFSLLRDSSQRDPLTGLYNYGVMMEIAEKEYARAVRYNTPFSCLMIDVNDFKGINDQYGHHAGDIVLKNVADFLVMTTRKTDIVCRYGGDEFCIFLTNTWIDGAIDLADKLESVTARLDQIDIEVSLSIGESFVSKDISNAIELINLADAVMYMSKKDISSLMPG